MIVKFRPLIPVDQIKKRKKSAKKGCIQVGRTVEFISAIAIIGTSLYVLLFQSIKSIKSYKATSVYPVWS